MTKYSAADFANARFAEHPRTGELAFRTEKNIIFPWETVDGIRGNDEGLSGGGWVPVPSKPVLTDSEVGELVPISLPEEYLTGFIDGFERAGGAIIPDPEPTNAEKIKAALAGVGIYVADRIAERLDEAGVTAPKESN